MLRISFAFSYERNKGKRRIDGYRGKHNGQTIFSGNLFFLLSFIKSREKSYLCQWDSQRVAGKVARRPKYALINYKRRTN